MHYIANLYQDLAPLQMELKTPRVSGFPEGPTYGDNYRTRNIMGHKSKSAPKYYYIGWKDDWGNY